MEKKKTNEIVADVVDKATQTGKRGKELAVALASQTASGSKALASGIAKGAKEFSDKVKVDSYNRRLKKYNPIFEEEYKSSDFFIPNIICIVDDAVRRDIDVCKGAIGWRENKKGTEVLFLYDEYIEQSGLCFVPTALCDEVYYVDAHDRNRFVKLDCVFQQSHEEKVAELEHIAYSLGAKSCIIEIEEKEIRLDNKKKGTGVSERKSITSATEEYNAEMSSDSDIRCSSKSETKFSGNNQVIAPVLKWFKHDKNILNLIEYRCEGGNEIKTKTLKLSGSSSATMSRKAAYSIDAAVSDIGINQTYSMEARSVRESTLKIIYHLEF